MYSRSQLKPCSLQVSAFNRFPCLLTSRYLLTCNNVWGGICSCCHCNGGSVLQVSDKVPKLSIWSGDLLNSNPIWETRRYGKTLIEQYATFKDAADEINERVLC